VNKTKNCHRRDTEESLFRLDRIVCRVVIANWLRVPK
jgi:hypothetical protein